MLRVHFTTEDLGRLQVAATADPLWEALLSRNRMAERRTRLIFQPWRSTIRGEPHRATLIRPGAQLYTALAPLGPYFPDFLTPAEAAGGLDAGLEAILTTGRHRFCDELNLLARYARVPAWARPMAEGDPTAIGNLVRTMRSYYDAAIGPYREPIRTSIEADRAIRARAMLDGGAEGLLASLRPFARWCPPVLEVRYLVDRDLHLEGRGLRLVPSFFCQDAPISLADDNLSPVLVYPLDPAAHWVPSTQRPGPLGALVGRNRAAILEILDTGATTTELARRLKITPTAISQHTRTLRDSGLITTFRHNACVVHTRTSLGTDLLNGATTAGRR